MQEQTVRPGRQRQRRISVFDGQDLKKSILAGAAWLEKHKEAINALNVFPVPDGDTGSNMSATMQSAIRNIAKSSETSASDIAARLAHDALLGARGNSGVILSQTLRGLAAGLAGKKTFTAPDLADAMQEAERLAYRAVIKPVEGTILTVVREMAARVASELAHMDVRRLGPETSDEEQNAVIAEVIERALAAGEDSVKRGPDLLPVLREAGVVDAGGYALTVLLAGIVGALRGSDPPSIDHQAAARVTHPQHESSTYRYCTNFAVTGTGLEQRRFVPALEALGDSVLVVGDQTTLKVHVHTDDPDAATAVFDGAGMVSHLDVADMRVQVAQRSERLRAQPPTEAVCGALAVVAGDGMRALFESLGVQPLDGGPTLNPSTYDLLAAIHAVPAEEVVVLANSPNVVMAAERAAELSDKRVAVVASRSQQAGLAAAVSLDPDQSAAENAAAMNATLERVRTGAVAPAARDDLQGRFREGDAVGFVDEQIVAWGRPREALRTVLESLADGAELITCLRGAEAPLDDETVHALAAGEVEFEISHGGQPSYWWLLSAE